MGTASFNGYTAKGSLGGLAAKVTLGGGGGLSNDIPRSYGPEETPPVELPPATVTTPQPYDIFYTDGPLPAGVLWFLAKNTTTWAIVEKGQ
jgi:hypothetical protein